MNFSNFIHGGVAGFIVLLFIPLHFVGIDGDLIGAAFGIALFYGREMRDHQRERQTAGDGHRNKFQLADFAFWDWKQDSFMDVLFPIIFAVITVINWRVAIWQFNL